MVRERLNVVHQTKQRPLSVHLRSAAQREAREALVVAHVAKTGSTVPKRAAYCDRPSAVSIRCFIRCVKGFGTVAFRHERMPLAVPACAEDDEGTARAAGTADNPASPANGLPRVAADHIVLSFPVQRLPRWTHTHVRAIGS
jgi:hypothetical protein